MIIPPDFAPLSRIPAEGLAGSIESCRRDLLSGLVEIEFEGGERQTVLFAHGQLAVVYQGGEPVQRLDPLTWLASLNGRGTAVHLRSLALTPQDVRIMKILIEQQGQAQGEPGAGLSLKQRFDELGLLPDPVLVQVCWPRAEALALLPGAGGKPSYSLLLGAESIRRSDGDLRMILDWNEKCESLRVFHSGMRTQAWTEFLLHQAFRSLVSSLLGRFDKLIGRVTLNQIVRDVNFKATAHDWNLSISAGSVNDQAIPATPSAAAEVYSRLLEVIFSHFESVLGGVMLEMLVREAVYALPPVSRKVVEEYLPITNMGG